MPKLLLILYGISCILYFGIKYQRNKPEQRVRLSLALFFPLLGLLLPFFWPKKWHEHNIELRKQRNLDIVEGNVWDLQDKPERYSQLETEKELNVLPLEEVLLVNDLEVRRRTMIDLLKKDSIEHMEVLKLAVSNEDTETSHYAVSAIIELKRKLTLNLQELEVKFEKDPMDPHLIKTYMDVLKAYIGSGFLDERTLNKHRFTLVSLLERYLQLVPDKASFYEDKIACELELGDYLSAENTAVQYLEKFPNNENAYLLLMKVYYSVRSYSNLQSVLNQLKQSSVRLSNKGLNMVRFWSEGAY